MNVEEKWRLEKLSTTIKFKHPQEFWCCICDSTTVKSDDEETGRFFSLSGHRMDTARENGPPLQITTEFGTFCFAICTDCLKKENAE